ncbi:MAG: tRNA dihydrouridine synthase DusB [Bacilli bacterium]|nr:tRNA dihydrouridine synthase DusB [Bacilli bacterium]
MWQIGNIKIKNRVVLAPMAGISNAAYFKILEEFGVGLVFTELISAEAIVRQNNKTLEMLKGIETVNIPVGVQIFGSNPDTLSKAAKKITDLYKNVFIDINMGCPVPKVAIKSSAGSALLKDVNKIQTIVSSVVKSVNVPVTVKIRSGWDSEHINALEVAKTIEKAGASAITIHPRTRAQGYSGKANWDIIKDVKEAVNIPVIGNGDIKSCYDALDLINKTKCDAVMIGRASLGNPWIFKECIDFIDKKIEPKEITTDEKLNMILKHFNYLLTYKNEHLALLEIRTHAAHYLKGLPNVNNLKQNIFKTTKKQDFIDLINSYKGV